MKVGHALLLAGLGIVAFAGADYMGVLPVFLNDDQRRFAAALAAAFKTRGIDPRWGVALGLTETNLRALTNLVGPDGERGGSYGPTQISQRTARAYGFTGSMTDLLDPHAAAELTADMVRDGFAERKVNGVSTTFYYGPPATPESMAAVWNAGRVVSDADLPFTTKAVYIPRLLRFLSQVG